MVTTYLEQNIPQIHLYIRDYMQVCIDGEIIHCGQCNDKMYGAGVLTVEAMYQRVQNNHIFYSQCLFWTLKNFYVTLSVYAPSFLIVKWSDHIKCRERHCISFQFYTEKSLHFYKTLTQFDKRGPWFIAGLVFVAKPLLGLMIIEKITDHYWYRWNAMQ